MPRLLYIFFCFIIFPVTIPAQEIENDFFFQDDTVTMYDHAATEDGYHLFIPTHFKRGKKMNVIVFVHGYGAINPMIYGRWIKHLVAQKQIVIYPRYQERLLKPAATEFAKNTAKGINDAFEFLGQLNVKYDHKKFFLIGHSYGGVISANLAARADSLSIPLPLAIFVCEPGTGPFTGGILEDYSTIPPKSLMTIIVGMNDLTVGQKFGEYLFEKTTHLNNRSLIYQFPYDSLSLTATHYEPYSLDTLFDIGHRNFTANKSFKVSKYDVVDTKIYWPILDLMINASRKRKTQNIQNILWPMIYGLGSSPTERAILDIKY